MKAILSPTRQRRQINLTIYRKKRDFTQTKEPVGNKNPNTTASAKDKNFVIHKHAARRLHYDLRLEMEGILKSWAVPKGPPSIVGQKALALHVEDHPLDYGFFEGTIPAGNYGAGTVMIWDRGKYECLSGEPLAAYKAGKLHLRFSGKKMKGEWMLLRMVHADKENAWLFIKMRTNAKTISDIDRSVVSGRSMEEIANGLEKKVRSTAGTIRIPKFIEPMKALLTKDLPSGSQWSYEVKFDGYRALAFVQKDRIVLMSRNRNDLSSKYPEVIEALKQLPCTSAILDGEIVALDPQGHPSFQLLQQWNQPATQTTLRYYIFDLLELTGKSLLDWPIEERRAALKRLLKKVREPIQLSPVFEENPKHLLTAAVQSGMEGLIAKRRKSVYEPGLRSGAWRKFKLVQSQEFVIGGYTPPSGTRKYFGALLIGYYVGDHLHYAGKVGSGFNTKQLHSLYRLFQTLHRETCPFVDLPETRRKQFGETMTFAAMRRCHWIEPELVCQIRFSEWTHDERLRQPVFLALRDDKNAKQVRREKPV